MCLFIVMDPDPDRAVADDLESVAPTPAQGTAPRTLNLLLVIRMMKLDKLFIA